MTLLLGSSSSYSQVSVSCFTLFQLSHSPVHGQVNSGCCSILFQLSHSPVHGQVNSGLWRLKHQDSQRASQVRDVLALWFREEESSLSVVMLLWIHGYCSGLRSKIGDNMCIAS